MKDIDITDINDLNKLRSAPKLNKQQSEMILNQLEDIVHKADWVTIGVMSPSLIKGIDAVRKIELKFNFNKMECISLPSSDGPIFLKANQKTREIHARIEHGLGEGILISCHNDDNSVAAKTVGPFPLDFFNQN